MIAALTLLPACVPLQPVATLEVSAAAVRLHESLFLVQQIAAKLPVAPEERARLDLIAAKLIEIDRCLTDAEHMSLAALLQTLSPLELTKLYHDARAAYLSGYEIVSKRFDLLEPHEQAEMRRFDSDARLVASAIEVRLTQLGSDDMRILRDVLSLLPVLVKIGLSLVSAI